MRTILEMMGLKQIPRGTMKVIAFEESFFNRLDIGRVSLDSFQVSDLETQEFKYEKRFGPYTAVLIREQNEEVRYQVDLYDERRQNEPNLSRFLRARKSFKDPKTALRTYIALLQHLPKLE